MKILNKVSKYILLLLIFIFTCSCSINNNIHIVRADIVSLYGHEAYLINDANNEKLQSLKKYEKINDYNEEYFINNSLIIIVTQADSSSIKYSVTNLEINDNKCVVSIEGKSKDYVTMDLVSQYIFIELDNIELDNIEVKFERIINR